MSKDVPELVPVRMLNEFAYCPRLFYLEWVQGEWADNAHTEEGRFVHRRVDKGAGGLDAPEEAQDFKARAVALSAPEIGLSTRIDVVEGEAGQVCPVEYKKGEPPSIPGRVWEPEKIQLCAQALVLRENGFRVEKGFVYFSGTRERVEVPIDEALERRTRELLVELRSCAASGEIPPPLVDSPKCAGCSLNAICLPDEVQFLRDGVSEVRLLYPARDDAIPLYVQKQGARIGVSNEVLQVREPEGAVVQEVRLADLSQVNVLGNVGVTTQAIRSLCQAAIPLSFFSYGGWYYGRLEGTIGKNVELRQAQYRSADMPGVGLQLARRFVAAKIGNSRTLLRRNHEDAPRSVLDALDELRTKATEADSVDSLLGIEGAGARAYFGAFSGMLRPPKDRGLFDLDFERRNRRPPTDPINSLLSFCYALLTKDWTIAIASVGLDPYLGFFHRPRYGRPSLALDLMEEFRPIIADSVVVSVVNNGIVQADDFTRTGLGVALKPPARKRVIEAYERRMDQLVTHPVFDYRISYRRVLDVQARLLGRFLLGELKEYPSFLTR